MDQSKVRKRRYSFTINNPRWTPSEFVEILTSEYAVKYMIVSHETGEKGTDHLQGYVEFTHGATWEQVKDRFKEIRTDENGIVSWYQFGHIEVSIADGQANKKYVLKSQPNEKGIEHCEYGEMLVKTSVDDIASEVMQLLDENIPLLNIARDYPIYANYIVKNWKTLKDIEIFIKSEHDLLDKKIPF